MRDCAVYKLLCILFHYCYCLFIWDYFFPFFAVLLNCSYHNPLEFCLLSPDSSAYPTRASGTWLQLLAGGEELELDYNRLSGLHWGLQPQGTPAQEQWLTEQPESKYGNRRKMGKKAGLV